MLTQSFLSRLLNSAKSSRLVFVMTIGLLSGSCFAQSKISVSQKLDLKKNNAVVSAVIASNKQITRKDIMSFTNDYFDVRDIKVTPKAYGPPDIPPVKS